MKRVFLSFTSENLEQVPGFRLLAKNPNYDLDLYDESIKIAINSTNADYIKRVISEKNIYSFLWHINLNLSAVYICTESGYC